LKTTITSNAKSKYLKILGIVMQVLDFAHYSKKKKIQQQAEKMQALRSRLKDPGVVIELKRELTAYIEMTWELKKAS
jgi:hypothetical protein